MSKNTISTIFIHLNNHYQIDNKKRYNIILSPAFYWVKKELLEISNPFTIKKLAPSIFHGVIPNGDYRYKIIKGNSENEYFFFAYNEKEILEKLSNSGIKKEQIAKLYFAQNELYNIKEPILIDEKNVLITKDNIVLLAPLSLVPNPKEIDWNNISLSKNNITLNNTNSHGIKSSNLYLISFILVLLIALFGIEFSYYAKAINNIEKEKEELLEKKRLPKTDFQLQAIKSSLIKKRKKSNMLSSNLKKLFSFPIEDEYLKSINVTNKHIKATIISKNETDLKKLFPKSVIYTRGDTLIVEIKL